MCFMRTVAIISCNGSQLQCGSVVHATIHHSKLGTSSRLLPLQPGGLWARGRVTWSLEAILWVLGMIFLSVATLRLSAGTALCWQG